MNDVGPARCGIFTIGHSTRSADELVALLHAHGVRAIADVRRFPASRRHPQFNREAFAARLEDAAIEYHWLPELGGRRRARADSRNTAWRNAGFRGYADYMETAEFGAGMERLQSIARGRPTAILCAEALWWRCHRALIADSLTTRGWRVCHIADPRRAEDHFYTAPARIVGGKLSYAEDRLI